MTTCFLAPDPIQSMQFIPGGIVPAAGGKLFFYVAGSVSTKQTVYKDNAAAVSWSNPIVLDSGGNLPSGGEVWFPTGQVFKAVLAPFNDTDPPGSPYWSKDNLPGINDVSSISVASSMTFTYAGTGAVSTTVQSHIREQVSVLGFAANGVSGALVDPTGVLDSTLGIQAAINSLPTASPNPGGLVYMPAGVYKISAPITLPNGVALKGETVGPNNINQQGATVIDATLSPVGILSTTTFGIAVRSIAVKNAINTCIKLIGVQFYALDEIACFGTNVSTGVWLASSTYFGSITRPNINGIAAASTAVGLRIDGASNETVVEGGAIRQNATNVVIDGGSNGSRFFGVDMEGSSTQTGISISPTGSADAVVIGCRFEALLNGIVCGSTTSFLTAMGNWYGASTINGIVDNSTNKRMAIFEPSIFNCVNATSGVLGLQMHDALSTGVKLGATTIKNISGGVNISNNSGKLLLTTAGGNAVQTDTNVPIWIGNTAAPTVSSNSFGLGSVTTATVGAAGTSAALPANPVGYWSVNAGGNAVKIPFYNP
jgi:hypothetical protein